AVQETVKLLVAIDDLLKSGVVRGVAENAAGLDPRVAGGLPIVHEVRAVIHVMCEVLLGITRARQARADAPPLGRPALPERLEAFLLHRVTSRLLAIPEGNIDLRK